MCVCMIHTYIYPYAYLYLPVCVCVCVYTLQNADEWAAKIEPHILVTTTMLVLASPCRVTGKISQKSAFLFFYVVNWVAS